MQILPNVFLVNGFPYGRHQNSYLVRTGRTAFIVDAGDLEQDSFDSVKENCARWGVDLSEVSHLLVTHAHFDHASHAARLRSMGAKIVAGRDTADAMAAGDRRCIGFAVGRTFEPCETDIVVDDCMEIDIGGVAVRCIAAPGHANGHMVFEVVLGGERVWFSGDMFEVGPECRGVNPCWQDGPDFDPQVYVDTLGRLAQMGCDTLLPGHGPPGIGIGAGLVDMAYARAISEWKLKPAAGQAPQ